MHSFRFSSSFSSFSCGLVSVGEPNTELKIDLGANQPRTELLSDYFMLSDIYRIL